MHDHCSLTNVEEIDETQFIINIDMTSTLSAREELSVRYVDAVLFNTTITVILQVTVGC